MKIPKVFILALDGATWDVIDPLMKKGLLPNFNKIINKGTRAVLETTTPPLTPCAWTSFITGKNPGKHGVCDFYFIDENKNLKLNSAFTHSSEKDLWDFLSEKGIKSLVFNVPITYPPKELNGIMISDSPSIKADFTFPKDYKLKLLKKFPEYRVEEDKKYGEDRKSKNEFFKDVYDLDLLRFKVVNFLLENEDWDFFMAHFSVLDQVQHWYWKFMDKTHPYYTEEEYSDNIPKAYQLIDQILGDIYQKLPSETVFIIMSDHGFGKYIQDVNINMWLNQEGYLFFRENLTLFKKLLKKTGFSPNKILKVLFFLRLNNLLKIFPKRVIHSILDKSVLTYKDIDWSRTKAYSHGYYGSIYLNREVVREADYELLREEIIKKLKTIKDPFMGKCLFDNIWKKEELYYGPKSEKLPDIMFAMQNYSYGSSSTLAFQADKLFSDPITHKSGDHRKNGIFIICGKDIQKGTCKPVNMLDLLPTLLHIYGCKIPQDLDGNLRSDILKI